MNLGKEMVDEGRVKLVYARAKDKEADGFSKLRQTFYKRLKNNST
jgi:hypothetical protein